MKARKHYTQPYAIRHKNGMTIGSKYKYDPHAHDPIIAREFLYQALGPKSNKLGLEIEYNDRNESLDKCNVQRLKTKIRFRLGFFGKRLRGSLVRGNYILGLEELDAMCSFDNSDDFDDIIHDGLVAQEIIKNIYAAVWVSDDFKLKRGFLFYTYGKESRAYSFLETDRKLSSDFNLVNLCAAFLEQYKTFKDCRTKYKSARENFENWSLQKD